MALSEQAYNRLVDYLNRSLTPEEEKAFVQELNENEELQREFDFELLLRESGKKAAEAEADPAFESAADHLRKVESILHPAAPPEPETNGRATVRRLKPGYAKIISIAASLLLVAALAVFYVNRKNAETTAGAKPPVKTPPVIQPKDSLAAPQSLPEENESKQIAAINSLTAEQAYAKNYTAYESGSEDPAEVSKYYNAYRYDKDYEAVLNATAADYQTKGTADSAAGLYLQFYQALSWLERGNAAKAAGALQTLLRQTDTGSQLYASAHWYRAMALLKTGSVSGAKKALQAVAVHPGPSPYKTKARNLLRALENR
jgi:hypothetical protein